jgi:translation initiation factor 2 alpha subunit (eIF-2alpha)
MELEQGDVVLCTVDRIVGTTVFVKIHSHEGELEGTIVTSEIAPGRIRNLRDYVVPKKEIVCKVLRISGSQIHLSLRRVTQKEKKEVLEEKKQEKGYESVIKSVMKEKAQGIIEKIKISSNVYDFIEEAKENPHELEKLLGKENTQKILEIVKNQKEKKVILKKTILLTTHEPEGILRIKEIFNNSGDFNIKYISAGKYSIKKESTDLKKANQELKNYIETLEKFAKENNLNITIE